MLCLYWQVSRLLTSFLDTFPPLSRNHHLPLFLPPSASYPFSYNSDKKTARPFFTHAICHRFHSSLGDNIHPFSFLKRTVILFDPHWFSTILLTDASELKNVLEKLGQHRHQLSHVHREELPPITLEGLNAFSQISSRSSRWRLWFPKSVGGKFLVRLNLFPLGLVWFPAQRENHLMEISGCFLPPCRHFKFVFPFLTSVKPFF